MSRRREIAQRLHSLTDIAGIMSAMKGLALMETRALGELVAPQLSLVAAIETCAARFLDAHGELLAPANADASNPGICILVGSQQGFCRDFNETLLARADQLPGYGSNGAIRLLVGSRLASRCDPQLKPIELPGASVSREVPAVLLRLTRELKRLLTDDATRGASVCVLYHCDALAQIRLRRLLPIADLPPSPHAPYPPRLNLSPADFLSGLTGHYLYAVLNEVLYSSLLAENRLRLAHMDSALNKLDEDCARLQLKYNAQRQEDIIEEIELIMLSAQP